LLLTGNYSRNYFSPIVSVLPTGRGFFRRKQYPKNKKAYFQKTAPALDYFHTAKFPGKVFSGRLSGKNCPPPKIKIVA